MKPFYVARGIVNSDLQKESYNEFSIAKKVETTRHGTLTASKLKKLRVGDLAVAEFKQRFGKSMDITEDNVREGYNFFQAYIEKIFGYLPALWLDRERYPEAMNNFDWKNLYEGSFEHTSPHVTKTEACINIRVKCLTEMLLVKFSK